MPNAPEETPPPKLSAFAQNLQRIVDNGGAHGSGSVNAWARAHSIPQPTVRRLLIGAQSPTLEMLELIALKIGLQPWQLLVPGLDHKNAPMLAAESEALKQLYANLMSTTEAIKGHLADAGNTDSGDLVDLPEPISDGKTRRVTIRRHK